eukprot:10046317-Ditylum_brightwellii.AAC.1
MRRRKKREGVSNKIDKRKSIYTHCMQQLNIYYQNKKRVHVCTVTQCHQYDELLRKRQSSCKISNTAIATAIVSWADQGEVTNLNNNFWFYK